MFSFSWGRGGNSSQQIVLSLRRPVAKEGQERCAHPEGEARQGMGTRLSSQPLPLSPSAVTLNNSLSLITATITLRNKLVFVHERHEDGGKETAPVRASARPLSLPLLGRTAD